MSDFCTYPERAGKGHSLFWRPQSGEPLPVTLNGSSARRVPKGIAQSVIVLFRQGRPFFCESFGATQQDCSYKPLLFHTSNCTQKTVSCQNIWFQSELKVLATFPQLTPL